MSEFAGRFCWYELGTTDRAGAEAFYKKVVGWKTKPFPGSPMPYTLWVAGDREVGGLMDLPEEARKMGAPPHWMGYVAVDDADAIVNRAKGLGATVYVPPTDIPNVGRFAILADPTGAAFAVIKGTPQPGQTPSLPSGEKPGEVGWHELYTSDPDKAWAFYESLFGWRKTEAMDMGPDGIYQMYAKGEKTLGGYMKKPAQMPMSAWCYYFTVPELPPAVEAIKTSGGTIANGPMQVPGGGWIVQAIDPQGAYFALFAPAAKT